MAAQPEPNKAGIMPFLIQSQKERSVIWRLDVFQPLRAFEGQMQACETQ